jgi:aminoglycoside phosphotransferase (APT) family kinase protein
MATRALRYHKGQAAAFLRSALASAYGAQDVTLDQVVHLGEGLSRHAYGAYASWVTGEGAFVVLCPTERGQEELWRREYQLLERLARRGPLPFQVPRPVAVLSEGEAGMVVVVTRLRGAPLDQWPTREPCATLGQLAAAVHALDVQDLIELLPSHPSRRAHARAHLVEELEGLPGPEAAEALAWGLEHLPPEEPPHLVHGDLLGQNVLVDPLDPAAPVALVDWEAARVGDPAYDLAILTRGVRRPFRLERGLERLLEAYQTEQGAAVTVQHVRLHELCMAGLWYRQALDRPRGEGEAPEEARARLARVLKMAMGR